MRHLIKSGLVPGRSFEAPWGALGSAFWGPEETFSDKLWSKLEVSECFYANANSHWNSDSNRNSNSKRNSNSSSNSSSNSNSNSNAN